MNHNSVKSKLQSTCSANLPNATQLNFQTQMGEWHKIQIHCLEMKTMQSHNIMKLIKRRYSARPAGGK